MANFSINSRDQAQLNQSEFEVVEISAEEELIFETSSECKNEPKNSFASSAAKRNLMTISGVTKLAEFKMHRGMLLKDVEKNFLEDSAGEFGAGKYFWYDNYPAAVMCALKYHGEHGQWAVVEFTCELEEFQNLAKPNNPDENSKVLEFYHGFGTFFNGSRYSPTGFVIPPEFKALTSEKKEEWTLARDKWIEQFNGPIPKTPNLRAYGRMLSQDFRKINECPRNFNLVGEKQVKSWHYNVIIGLCAAWYKNERLVQIKFANDGLKFVNNLAVVNRKLLMSGPQIIAAKGVVDGWVFENYDSQIKDILERAGKKLLDVDINRLYSKH